jgi:hypothetical protein
VRRLWIHHILPTVFCAIPLLGAVLIFAAVPPAARADYLHRLQDSAIDWIILAIGTVLFVSQTVLGWKALKWRELEAKFDERPDHWLSHLAQAAEWFPLLGLIGTVAAILQTFSSFGPGSRPAAEEIIQKYGPAITATGSGLFMALMNILPAWMVKTGRMLIQSLADAPVVPLSKVGDPRP